MQLVKILMDKISEFDVLNAVTSHEVMEMFSISHSFDRGWACRQKQGNMYGDNFVTSFKDDISDIFERRYCDYGEK